MSEGAQSERNDGKAAAVAPAPVDPWRGFRGICAATLILEVIVVLLAIPVLSYFGRGPSWVFGLYIGGLTVALILGAGLQRRSWAMKYNVTLQVLMVAGFVFHWTLGVMGVVFLLVWAFIIRVRTIVAQRFAEGTLTSQHG
ncbi:DUF4233 domain-containing protein [Smaragdicoccus niigatensis]|uniref:DUF4233 domain-containing protein n=1 Tax=Smaragdicoccus niigatensis TaxID=359359 RepID=UPI00037AAB99|nr:DUF4233 domain-containing protein [Smaragdicoccus niigatensis]